MILKLLFLHKNKSINIEELKSDFSSIFEFNDDEIIHNELNYHYEMDKAFRGNNILLSISIIDCRYNLKNAKLIDNIKCAVKNGKHRGNYRIITVYDDSSKYFCDKLSVIISKFERILRQFIYLTVILAYEAEWIGTINEEIKKTHKQKRIDQRKYLENALEEFSFNDYINYLFKESEEWSNELIIEECKNEINKIKPNINRISNILEKSVKKSLWNRLFYEYNINLTKEDLEKIRLSRNKVMHNKDFSYSEFNSIKKLLTKLTKTLENEIININEAKYKENENVTAAYNSIKDAFLNALESNKDFSLLLENLKNINMGVKKLVLSDRQLEFIKLRKKQEEIIRQYYSQNIKYNMDNFSSIHNLKLNLPNSPISEISSNDEFKNNQDDE